MLEDIQPGERLTPDHPVLSATLPEILSDAFRRHAHCECLSVGEKRYTYAEVDAASARIANALRQAGLREGDPAAVYSRNSADAFLAMLGILRAGAVWIPVNPYNPLQQNTGVLLRFGVRTLLYQAQYVDAAQVLRDNAPDCKALVCLDDGGAETMSSLSCWAEGASERAPVLDLGPDDLASIPMTGGTTGEPRGVKLTQRAFAAICYGMCESYTHHDVPFVMLCAAPMSHVSGRFALTSLPAGGRCVVMDGVDLDAIPPTIEAERITHVFLPPTAIYGLLDRAHLKQHDLSSLREFIYGSSPMAPERLRQALAAFGPVMRGGYGQSECPMFITALWQQDHYQDGEIASDERLSSVGRATVLSEVAVLDENGNPLANGETGEIGVKSLDVFAGYWDQPGSAEASQFNGWHLTGDIGRFDAEGYLHIVDRKKDMIISGGFNVYSAEVEQALAGIPGVAMAAVIGVPDHKWGEAVMALIKPVSGADVTADAIITQSRRLLGPVKTPKRVEFVDELPFTKVGKLDKKSLRSRYNRPPHSAAVEDS